MASRVYGNMTVAHARREELAADIAALVGIGVRAVRNRLEETHGKTRLRVAFEAEWPPPRVELARLTTSAALELDLVSEIAAVVDLTPRQVRGFNRESRRRPRETRAPASGVDKKGGRRGGSDLIFF